MKLKYYPVLLLSLIYSSVAMSTSTIESTDDYAYGAELELTDNQSMFSRIKLNQLVYTQTVFPDLRDVRVFNRNGNSVPFALVNVYEDSVQAKSEMTNLTIYPLGKPTQDKDRYDNERYSVTINGQNVSVDARTNGNNKYIASYLLQFPDGRQANASMTSLQLTFKPDSTNWQATASVNYSNDLKKWYSAIYEAPLMSLTNQQGQSLTLNELTLPSYGNYSANNWLITLVSNTPIPEVEQVKAIASESSSSKTSVAGYPINFEVHNANEHSVIYQLPASIPVNELTIRLRDAGSVLPVAIYYKQQASDKDWSKLDEKIIRRSYDDETIPTVNAYNKLIQQIKIEAINSSIYDAPDLIAYRDKVDVVFNSANNGPFILAWGSAQAKSAALPVSNLLSDKEVYDQLPVAKIGDSVKLAGEKALVAQIEKDKNNSQLWTWVIWIGLIVGAGLLVLLALKLLKEVKKQD